MTTVSRQIKSFEGQRNAGHEQISEMINDWIKESHAIPVSMTVTTNTHDGHLTAFLIYELPPEKQRSLGIR